jgi:hypothetical protein
MYHDLLQKFGQGLDEVHPFSYTEAVENLLRDADTLFALDWTSVSGKNAVRIWAFVSKFVMLDRFATTLGVAEVYRGKSVPKQPLLRDDVGAAAKVSVLVLNNDTSLNHFAAAG